MSILSFYNRILSIGSLTSDVEGSISASLGKTSVALTSGGKRMVLPAGEVLAMPDKSKVIIFHPLSENTVLGESEVMSRYRNAINLTLNLRMQDLLGHIIELASSPAAHGHLKTGHLQLMTVLKDADKKSYETWSALMNAMPPGNTEECLVHIYLRKNASIGGRTFRRAAVVTFPLYEELCKETENVIYGVKLRKKDFAAFRLLLETIFPGIQEKNSYSRGGASEIAPSLDALLKASMALVGPINDTVEQFEDVTDVAELRYPDNWVEEAMNLDAFAQELNLLPPQVGNEGTTERQSRAGVVTTPGSHPGTIAMPTNLVPTSQWAAQQPVAPQEVMTKSGKLDMRALIHSSPQLQMIAPMGNNGQMGMGQYGYGMQQPQLTGAQALRQAGPGFMNPLKPFTQQNVF